MAKKMKYQGYKINKGNPEKKYKFTVFASNKEEATQEALDELNPKYRSEYQIEFSGEPTPQVIFTPAADFHSRTGLRMTEWEAREGREGAE